MLPILQIGPLAIQAPGLILLLGLWLGLYLAEKLAIKNQYDAGNLYNLAFFVLISAIIGGRLAYIIEYHQAFIASPLSIFSINTTLFNGWGAAASALIAALWYGQKHQLDFWSTLDLFTPAFATLSLFIGLAHLASGSAFGSASDLPWSIELWGARRHPTQIYEMISAALVLTIILKMFSSKKVLPKGILFLTFLILTTASRLFLEAFRGDSQMIDNVRTAQLAAWLILAVSLFLFGKRFFQPADQKNRDEISQTG